MMTWHTYSIYRRWRRRPSTGGLTPHRAATALVFAAAAYALQVEDRARAHDARLRLAGEKGGTGLA